MVAMGEGGDRFNGAEMGTHCNCRPGGDDLHLFRRGRGSLKLPTAEPTTNSEQLHPLNAVNELRVQAGGST